MGGGRREGSAWLAGGGKVRSVASCHGPTQAHAGLLLQGVVQKGVLWSCQMARPIMCCIVAPVHRAEPLPRLCTLLVVMCARLALSPGLPHSGPQVEIICASMGNALASVGGFCVGAHAVSAPRGARLWGGLLRWAGLGRPGLGWWCRQRLGALLPGQSARVCARCD